MAVSDALAASVELVGGWVACARDLARRVGAQALDPLVRLVGGTLRAGEPEPPRLPDSLAQLEDGGPQARVEEAKFHLGAPPARPARVDREHVELSRSYGVDRLVLLARDPWWLFAYWELTPATRLETLRRLGADGAGARPMLRVHDVTLLTFTGDNAWHTFEVELTPAAESWYLHVWQPGAAYCAEVGLRTASGRFVALLRSNTVTTPRAGPSTDTTVRWVDLAAAPPQETETRWRGERVPVEDGGAGRDDGSAGGDGAEEAGGSSDVHAPLR